MAEFTYDQIVTNGSKQTQNKSNVYYLSSILKNSGDSIYVRFPYKSTKDFKFVSIHKVKINDKFRNISCLRESKYESVDKCPLCSAKDENGASLYGYPKTKFIIQMIAYQLDKDGNVENILPCILEQSATRMNPTTRLMEPSPIVKVLATYIEDYNDLSKVPLKITKNGEGLSTNYVITPINATIWNEDVLPIDFSGFDNYNFSGHAYLERTEEELKEFVATGELPYARKTTEQQEQMQTNNVETKVEEQRTFEVRPEYTEQAPMQRSYTTVSAQQSTTTTQTTQTQDNSFRPARSPRVF